MRDVNIYGLIIITFLLGGFFTFLGWIIKSQWVKSLAFCISLKFHLEKSKALV